MTLEVLHDGGGFVVVAKPPRLLVIPGRGEDEAPSARELLQAQLGREVWVVHRLDRDTSGALLFALTAAAHRTLSMAFEAGRIQKTYAALVEGDLPEPLDVHVPLLPARKGKMRPARAGEGGKEARTLFRPRERFGRATLVEAEPLTGRTHQIRVHLRWAGHPLVVDPQYGTRPPLKASELGGSGDQPLLTRTPLHAERLVIPKLDGIPPTTVAAPLPEDLTSVLEALRAR